VLSHTAVAPRTKDAMVERTLFTTRFRRFTSDTRGANLVEYIILVGVIALIAIAGFKLFGAKVRGKIDEQAGSVGGINGAAK
jgi:Flp pilus assembly pilin Flp